MVLLLPSAFALGGTIVTKTDRQWLMPHPPSPFSFWSLLLSLAQVTFAEWREEGWNGKRWLYSEWDIFPFWSLETKPLWVATAPYMVNRTPKNRCRNGKLSDLEVVLTSSTGFPGHYWKLHKEENLSLWFCQFDEKDGKSSCTFLSLNFFCMTRGPLALATMCCKHTG